MKIALPFPPSVNKYWRMWRGRMVISAEGRQYHRDCLAVILASLGRLKPIGYRCEIRVVLHAADDKRRDIDNSMKAVFDTLKKCRVIGDDWQIDRLVVERGYVSRDNPRAELEILPFDKPAPLFDSGS